MNRTRFPLSSDQLELLLAFEACESLQKLAETMAKDSSVVSRNLQQLAETAAVITKVKGRWQISPLGLQVNEETRLYLKAMKQLLEHPKMSAMTPQFDGAALIIVNAQKGLLDPIQGDRGNDIAESNIGKLLSRWRARRDPVIHVRHSSTNPQSSFYKNATGFEFISGLSPLDGETVLDKTKSSAFTDTELLAELTKRNIDRVVIVGFTANECIDATARSASESGFTTVVVSDATASFDVTGPDGKLHRADRLHRLTMANIHALFANVVTTADITSV